MYTQAQKENFNRLRKTGLSLNELHIKLNIAKSTCSLWNKGLVLPKSAQDTLAAKAALARAKGRTVRVENLRAKYDKITADVKKRLQRYKITPETARLLCAVMYWGEGSKTKSSLTFTNSDPKQISAFLKLFRFAFQPDEKKFSIILHVHPYHDIPLQVSFWSGITGVPIEKIFIHRKQNSGKNIRVGYPGCVALNYNDVLKYKEIMAYFRNFELLYGGFV